MIRNYHFFNTTLKNVVFLLLLFYSFQIGAQDISLLETQLKEAKGGEKAEIQLRLSQSYLSKDLDKSIQYASDALELGEQLNSEVLKANANLLLAQAHYKKEGYSSSLNFAKRACELFKQNDSENYAVSEELIGDNLFASNQFELAITHFEHANKVYTNSKDYSNVGYLSSKIGSAYEKLNNFEQAIKWQKIAYINFENSRNIKEMILTKSILGGVYSNYGDYSSAEKELTKAFELANQYDLLDKFSELKKRLSVVRSNAEISEGSETQFELDQDQAQKREMLNAIKQKRKSLEEIEKLSEEKQLVELKIRVQQDEFEKKMLAEQLEKLKIKEDLKSEKLAKENLKLALNNEKLISDKKSAENRQLFITITLLVLVLILILLALLLKSRSNRNLALKNKEIEQQKEEIQAKQENINQSIIYAKRIQEAILPPHNRLKECFSDAFVYLNPKDNVSGDFLWTYKSRDACFVCVADCTGHGVPGAFMSIIFNNILDQAVKKEGVIDPAEILNRANTLLYEKVKEHHEDLSSFKDGMDAALLRIENSKTKLKYCGAKNGFTLIRGEEIQLFKGTRRSIEITNDDRSYPIFDSKTITIQEGDLIYLASDGFQDQKGGDDNTKFYRKPFNDFLLSISHLNLNRQKSELKSTFEEWKNQNDQVDDVLVVGLKI